MTELKNRMVVLLFLFGLVNYCTAQYINRTLNPQSSVSSFGSCMLHNADTTWIYGFKRDSSGLPYNVLLSLDELGEIQQELNYGIPGREVRPQYKAMVRQDGFFYLGLSSRVNDDTAYSHLYKCTPVGDTVWTRQYGAATGQFILYSLISHPEGGFVLLGIVKEELANESDIFILRTDTAGNELWRNYYGLPGKSEYVNPTFVHISGEEYFIGAGEIVPVFGNPDLNYYVKVFLLKRKNDGSFWKKDLSRPLQSEHTPLGIIKTSDGNFVYGSFTNDASVPYSTSAKGMMVKMNEAGDELWKNEIGDFGNANALSLVAEKPDGTLLFAGRKTTSLPLGNELAWVVHANAEGGVLSQTTFQWPGFGTALYYNLRDITLLPDGRLAGCGEIVADKQRIWFFVSDQNGCFDQFCTYLGEPVNESSQGFAIYPNPAGEWVYVYNPHTGEPLKGQMYNMEGRQVAGDIQLHSESTNALFLSGLPAGIYFLRVNLPGGRYLTEKIVKQ